VLLGAARAASAQAAAAPAAPATPAAAPALDTGARIDSASASAQRAALVASAVGDRIAINVWREPELSDSLTVDERGEIVVPRLGPFRVAGRTISGLQDTLRTRLSQYLRNPAIRVTVFRRIGVQGEVRAPSLYFVDVTMTLREVIALAGGLNEAGNPNDIVVVREGERIKLGKWRAGGPISTELRSGDQIVVGRRSWLSLNALAAVSAVALLFSVIVQVSSQSK
jgi:polysaccharide export outer membrane protein